MPTESSETVHSAVRFHDFYLHHYNRFCQSARLDMGQCSTWAEAARSPHAWAYMGWLHQHRHSFPLPAQQLIRQCLIAHNRLWRKRERLTAIADAAYTRAYDAAVADAARAGAPLSCYTTPHWGRRQHREERIRAAFHRVATAILVGAVTANPHIVASY